MVELLMSKGIDMNNNRFLILQGEVEQISLMKPISGKRDDPGLLEYLEDIIGSHKYVDQITELDDTMQTVRRQKESEMLMLHDLRKDLDSMSDKKTMAVKYVETEKRIYSFYHLMYHLQIFHSREKERHQTLKIQELDKKAENYKAELQKSIETSKSDFQTVQAIRARKKANEDEIIRLQKESDELSNEDQKYQQRLKSIITEGHELSSQIESIKRESKKTEAKIKDMKVELPPKEVELAQLKTTLEGLKKQESDILIKIAPKINSIKQKITENEQAMVPYDRELSKFEDKKKNIHHDLDVLSEREKKLAEEIEKFDREIGEQSKIIQRESENRDQIKDEYESAKTKLEDLTKRYAREEDVVKEVRAELMNIETKIEDNKSKNDKGLQTTAVLSYLMKSQEIVNSGGKVFGRIGDLGRVDPKYNIGISVVSPKFDSILVDSTETAKLCVNLLRRDRIGMARIVPLQKIRHFEQQMRNSFSPPPNSVRLFDVVQKKDENAAIAFYFILKDALFCENLDLAQKAADYNGRRYLVSTPQGFIISPEGSMSGGGKPRCNLVQLTTNSAAFMNEDEVPLEQLMASREQYLSAYTMANNDKDETMTQIQHQNQRQRTIPAKLRMIEENVQNEAKKLADLQIKQQAIIAEATDGRLSHNRSELQQEMDKISKSMTKILKDQAKLKEKAAELQAQIIEEGGSHLKEISENLEACQLQHDLTQQSVFKMSAEIEQSSKSLINSEKELEDIIKKIALGEQEKKEVHRKKNEVETKFHETYQELTRCKSIEDDIEREFLELQDGIQKLLLKINDMKQKNIKMKEEIEDAKEEQKAVRESIKKQMHNVDENKKKYLEFVESYSIIDELVRIERRVDSQPIENSEERGRPSRSAKREKTNQLLKDITPETDLTMEELKEMNVSTEFLRDQITQLQSEKDELSGDVEIIEIYMEKLMQQGKKNSEYNELCDREEKIRVDLNSLKDRRRLEFTTGFTFIAKKLKEVYQTITSGGDADLELIDSYDPFTEGIMFSVRPPHKSWKHMSKLSGGEKTLSSLSLIFALHYYKPTPIYFMDEIDAALDFRNVEIVAKFIKERTKNAQFIVISLRNHMFELANQLIGIYKVNDMTKNISIYPGQFIELINEDHRRDEEARRSQSINKSQMSQRLSSKGQGTKDNALLSAGKRRSVAASFITRQSKPAIPEDDQSGNTPK